MVRSAKRLLSAKDKSDGHHAAPDHREDLEANPRRDMKAKFRDAIGSVIEDGRRDQMKRDLQKSVAGNGFESYRKTREELKAMKKVIRQFYEDQNDRLDDWLEVDSVVRSLSDDILESFDPRDRDGDGIEDPCGGINETHEAIEPFLPENEREKRRKDKRTAGWAININVIANILLLAAKGVAVAYSSSLSLIASTVDSALDLLCTMIVWSTSKLVEKRIRALRQRFPVGRRRLEPIGILVFSIIMIVSFLQILQESVKKLLPGSPREAQPLPPTAIFAMASTIIVKGIIGLGCIRIKTTQVQALAQDCKTDVIFNTLSLLFPFIGYKAGLWWLDPVGAGLLSLFIIYDWASTCLENVARLTGAAVDDRVLKKLMFLCYRFSPIINSFKAITAYHAGDGVWCEVDLLLDQKAPLEHTHDVAETLQYCLEGLTEVDRAFVTVDYASRGPTGHVQE